MTRQLRFMVIVFCIFLALLSGCNNNSAMQDSTSPQNSIPASNPVKTQVASETPKPSEPTVVESLDFAKLDQLESYSITAMMYAKAGPAFGTKNRFEATERPSENSFSAVRYFQEEGKDFVWAEENICIGDSKWVQNYNKVWETGNSGSGMVYKTFLASLYIQLKRCDFTLVESVKLGNIDTKHYQITYDDSKSYLTGEIWLVSSDNLPPVPVKFIGEQGALDDAGHLIEDYRYIHTELLVSDINNAGEIKAP